MTARYKLLAFDLDGTLTNSDKIITPDTKAAIMEAMEAGASVVLASGRPVYGIMPLAKELGLDKKGGYILAYNGGCIIDCKTMEVVYEKKVPQELVARVCDYARDRKLTILTYEGDMIIASGENEYVEEEARINHLPVKVIGDMGAHIDFSINKFLITEHPDVVLAEIEGVKERFPELNVFRSAPFFMEIVPPDIDKAYSLSRLLEKMGLVRADLAAFGDGDNDASMLAYAGCGVAMGNAGGKCKAVADMITATNDEDGVAVALRKIMNKNKDRVCKAE